MFALTPRLLLRPGWPEDAAALADAIGHQAVVRNLAQAPWPYGQDDAAAFLALPRPADEPRFQIIARDDRHRLVGGIAVAPVDRDTGELGYWLTPDAWGRGYASEAARAVIATVRASLPVTRLTARPFLDNPASARLLARLGFVEAGRSTVMSRARGVEVTCANYVLDLGARAVRLPIAA